MKPDSYQDDALPWPSYEGLFGTIYCERCSFFGLGYRHPEWCRWQWLKEVGRARVHFDIVELGERTANALELSR